MSDPTPHRLFDLGDFALDSGVALPAARIAYATYGRLNAARDNTIIFPTWFVGTHLDLEWLIGDGRPLDTQKYFVVVPSMFANGLSSSPSNAPAPFDRARFPAITIQDNVRA
jgi:homoserine O-acetyltransferase